MADLRVAVAGATGLVGGTILRVLEERAFPVGQLIPLASERSAGSRVPFRGDEVEVSVLTGDSFAGCDIAFFSAGAAVSRAFAPAAAAAGALVIDNSSAFRRDPEIPLIVPEVNGDLLPAEIRPGIIANPNCSTIQMVVALEPLHRAFGLQDVIVSTYQSVSGSGGKGVRALDMEAEGGGQADGSPYPHPIAFNVLPHIDTFDADGWSGEERKMMDETRKIMRLPDLHVVPTTVRVPVRIGHAETIYARFASPAPAAAARDVLRGAPGIVVCDDPSDNVYPLPRDTEGRDEVFVGRVRNDPGDPTALALWVVADNVRKGAATNAVQIAERVVSGDVWTPSLSDTAPSSL
jgi:aspartate-semialdehyde dehydrogenase